MHMHTHIHTHTHTHAHTHIRPSKNHVRGWLTLSKTVPPLQLNPRSESENKSEKVREQEGERERQTERMRWDYKDNASRWREVEDPAGLSTPNGLKDFNGATNNRTDAYTELSRTRPLAACC